MSPNSEVLFHAAALCPRAAARRYSQLAEQARVRGDRLGAELFIDLAYEALSIRYDDAGGSEAMALDRAA